VSGEAIDVFETGSFFEIDDEHRLYVIGATLSDQDNQLVSASRVEWRRTAEPIISRDATQLQEIAKRVTTNGPVQNGFEGVTRTT